MSSVYQPRRKELAKVKVVSSENYAKNDIVKFFMDKQNKQKEVVYLVVPKKQSKKK